MYTKCTEWEKEDRRNKKKTCLILISTNSFSTSFVDCPIFIHSHSRGNVNNYPHSTASTEHYPISACLFTKNIPFADVLTSLNFSSVLAVLLCLTSDSLADHVEEVQATGPGYHTPVRALSRCLLTLASRQWKGPPGGAASPRRPRTYRSRAARTWPAAGGAAPRRTAAGAVRRRPFSTRHGDSARPALPCPRGRRGAGRGEAGPGPAAAGEAELTARLGRLRAFFFPPPSGGSSPSLSLRPELSLLRLLHLLICLLVVAVELDCL